MANIKVQTRNVDGLGDTQKRRKLFHLLKNSKATIFLLQETHSTEEQEDNWKNDWDGEILFSHGTSNSRGTAILIKDTINLEIKKSKFV